MRRTQPVTLETVAERIHRHHEAGVITDREHEAIHSHEVKGLSYRTIAQGLHLSVATVWDRVRRAEHKMRQADQRST